MSIKPIETIYEGYRFRSRLEARWAVFFNAMGIKYQYELEGFQLDKDTFYLPDFVIEDNTHPFEDANHGDVYIEVKGSMPDTYELYKARTLSEQLGPTIPVNVLYGDIGIDVKMYSYFWVYCDCPNCHHIHPIGRGEQTPHRWHPDRLLPDVFRLVDFAESQAEKDAIKKTYHHYCQLLETAFLKARQARFDHGEKPT